MGFFVGGVRNHGLSKGAITKQYRRGLELAGKSPKETNLCKYHGLRLTTTTLQLEYEDKLPESEVMKRPDTLVRNQPRSLLGIQTGKLTFLFLRE